MGEGGRIRRIELERLERIPESEESFLRQLGGPALLCIRGRGRDRSRVRAVATLLHGDEPSGLRAVLGRLRSGVPPAVDAVVFVGAVAAALEPPGFAHRFLPGHADLNRCFASASGGAEVELAREALGLLHACRPESLVDIHNNSGHSPPYAVTASLGDVECRLAGFFAQRVVHTSLRIGALFEATRGDFPSVVIECGRVGDAAADRAARAGLDRYLDAERLDAGAGARAGLEVLEDPLRVCVREGVRLAIADGPEAAADLTVRRDIDRHNFELLPAGAAIGWIGDGGVWPLSVTGADGRDVSQELFAVRGRSLELRRPVVPVMLTTDARAATSDCLFYAARRRPAVPD